MKELYTVVTGYTPVLKVKSHRNVPKYGRAARVAKILEFRWCRC